MKLLNGVVVANALLAELEGRIDALLEKGISPTLCLLRVGNRPDDGAYARQVSKKAKKLGISVVEKTLPEEVSQSELENVVESINQDEHIHGCLMFLPLPKGLDSRAAADKLTLAKDIDGASRESLAELFIGTEGGFVPATAEAVLRLLDFYHIEVDKKRVCVVGRSLVVGKPLAQLLQIRGATVTVVHTHTTDPEELTKQADILVVCAGKLHLIDENYVSRGQIVIDVGINWDASAKELSGDVDLSAIEPIVSAASPVPGGIGSITSACLLDHVVRAAEASQTL